MTRQSQEAPYRPVNPRRALGSVLRALALLSIVGRGKGAKEEHQPVWAQARVFVERRWGEEPDVALRFRDRQYVFATSFLVWTVLVFPGALLYGAGITSGLHWLGVSGALIILIASIPMGMILGTFYRMVTTSADYYRWKAAGSPTDWKVSIRSQYRETDLVWCLVGALASGFIGSQMLFT